MLLEKMPSVTLTAMDGQAYSTQQLHGKKALIFMWASW
ncbi:TlpA family protein disulfide reductase [Pseudalkalibacillus sp. A8]